jgi:O-antigen/teichoic acid export membrane protein
MTPPPRGTAEPSIAKNAIAAIIAQTVIYAAGFVGSAAIARALGTSGRGQYYVPVVAATMCFVALHLSVEISTAYFYAERRFDLKRLAASSSAIAAIVSPVAVATLLVFYVLAKESTFTGIEFRYVIISAAALPFMFHVTWMAGFYALQHRLAAYQLALLLGALAQSGGLIALATLHQLNVGRVLALFVLSYALPWILSIVWARDLGHFRPRWDPELVRAVIGHGLKIHVGLLAYFALLRVDALLVNTYLGVAAVGIYSVAVLLAELVFMVSTPLATAALPSQATVDIHSAAAVTVKAARFSLLIAATMALALASCGWLAIPLVYGRDFSDAYSALLILLPGVCAMAMCRPAWNWLVRLHRPYMLSAISLCAFCLNAGLNIVLLRSLGLVGASLASSLAYIVLAASLLTWTIRASGLSARLLLPQREDARTLLRLMAGIHARLKLNNSV